MTVARDAIRIENTGRFKFILVSKAPTWQIDIFRNDDKTYFSESLTQFLDTGLVSDFLVGRRRGFVYSEMRSKKAMGFFGKEAISMVGPTRKCVMLPLKGYAPQVEQIACGAFKLPAGAGLPLVVSELGDRNDWLVGPIRSPANQVFLTTKAITATAVDPSIFLVPKNFTLAKSVREVVAGTDIRSESVDAQVLFETGKDVTSKKK